MDARAEAEARKAQGARELTFAQMKAEYAALGYRFDRHSDCTSNARYLSGDRAGQSYPALSLYPVEADTGRSAFHVDARRDGNFKRLQALRNEVFAVVRGRIAEV